MFNKKFESQWQIIASEYHGNPDYLSQLKNLLIISKASSIKKVDDLCSVVFNVTIPGWTTAWNCNKIPEPSYEDEMGVEYYFPDDLDVGSRIRVTIDRYGREWSTIMVIELV